MKRGLSQVVQTIIFIGLAITTISLIALWQTNFFKDFQKDSTMQKFCSKLSFRADGFCKTIKDIALEDGSSSEMNVIAFNSLNDGTSQIFGFILILQDNAGNTEEVSTLPGEKLLGNQGDAFISSGIPSQFSSDEINQISVVPQMQVNGKVISCYEQKKIINKEEISETC